MHGPGDSRAVSATSRFVGARRGFSFRPSPGALLCLRERMEAALSFLCCAGAGRAQATARAASTRFDDVRGGGAGVSLTRRARRKSRGGQEEGGKRKDENEGEGRAGAPRRDGTSCEPGTQRGAASGQGRFWALSLRPRFPRARADLPGAGPKGGGSHVGKPSEWRAGVPRHACGMAEGGPAV